MHISIESSVDLVQFASALADQTRQRIMRVLCCRELSVSEIVAELREEGCAVTQPTISHHLAILRDTHLVLTRRAGQQVYYTLNQSQVALCCGRILLQLAPMTHLAAHLQSESAIRMRQDQGEVSDASGSNTNNRKENTKNGDAPCLR